MAQGRPVPQLLSKPASCKNYLLTMGKRCVIIVTMGEKIMLRIGRDSFLKDLLIWFLVSLIVASLLSAAGGALADRYLSRAVSGLIGEAGEYDLLFQVRSYLQEAAFSRLEEIIAENFPGSV